MSFWVYILKCADDSYYVGHTDNLDARMWHHNEGKIAGYTSTRLPVRLVFSQDHPTREEALASERQIKGWSRKKKEAMIRGDWLEVSRLARNRKTLASVHPATGSEPAPDSIRGRTGTK
jgi:predicted GIY-YIG superfamily endonuclease